MGDKCEQTKRSTAVVRTVTASVTVWLRETMRQPCFSQDDYYIAYERLSFWSGSPFGLWINPILLTSGSPFAWISLILLTSGSLFGLWMSTIIIAYERLFFWYFFAQCVGVFRVFVKVYSNITGYHPQ